MLNLILLYGCKAWSLTEKEKVILNRLQRKILREVYESVTEQRARRIRTDQELRELRKNPDLVADIKISQENV
jgi:hypothetical protein